MTDSTHYQFQFGEDSSPQAEIARILEDIGHFLPGQAPLLDFVHHNTLHGYQHLPFEEALATAERNTGIRGYLPDAKFRDYFRRGRIDDDDLAAAFAYFSDLDSASVLLGTGEQAVRRSDVLRLALLFDLEPISASQLNWSINELAALTEVQPDVPKDVKARFLASAPDEDAEKDKVGRLWQVVLGKLDLGQAIPHPEDMLDLSEEHAEAWLAGPPNETLTDGAGRIHTRTRSETAALLRQLTATIGESLTLGAFVKAITGIDILNIVRPQISRICAAALDDGFAAWQLPGRVDFGLYGSWRQFFYHDVDPAFFELDEWHSIAYRLPDNALDAIIEHLKYLQIPRSHWRGYLLCTALEMPGWAGMIHWREQRPQYPADFPSSVALGDLLAIRLTYDRLWLNQICRDVWKIDPKVTAIQHYFERNLSELSVRYALFKGELPEYLAQKAKALLLRARSERNFKSEWQALADQICTWQSSPLAQKSARHCHWRSGWQLFRLCQHLGVDACQLATWTTTEIDSVLACLNRFSAAEHGKVWLYAYERHYRESVFRTLSANVGRGRWARRQQRPEAQVVFCMDEREESFRRHLEELNPAIETLGAAGFFGIPIFYKGLDDTKLAPLCPVVVTPAHIIEETAAPGAEAARCKHGKGRKFNLKLGNLFVHALRRRFFVAHLLADAAAPFAFASLLAKILTPSLQARIFNILNEFISPPLPTRLRVSATGTPQKTTTEPALGFTDQEQADRIAGFLKATGLTYGFAPLVVLAGHGSSSQNNPHRAAYDCGACSGKHGGPNARAFAAMANRPEVRCLLLDRGITIPKDTWFIGAEHNTCNEDILWFDADILPPTHLAAFDKLTSEMKLICRHSAHERCRRLASAPHQPRLAEALAHIQARADDFSQARPELGHATNACALIGRRSVTQGAFFDRRVFLISYDPNQDPDGQIVENILLAVGPVGAGINLEYYFSTVDNERFGCGTKVMHNLIGGFAIMDGTAGELRTGLPNQMIEIHEPMRLQVIVEAKAAVLERIYQRQAPLRELIGNGWIHLNTIDPETGAIYLFDRKQGFVRWENGVSPVSTVATSFDAYRGQTGTVAPVLVRQPADSEA